MLDKNDLQQIRIILKEEVSESSDGLREDMKDLETGLRGKMQSLETGLRDEIRSVETGLRGEIKSLEATLKAEIQTSARQLSTEIGDFITDNVLPQIEEKADKTDIDRLERKIDIINTNVIRHETDIKLIKSHIGLTAE